MRKFILLLLLAGLFAVNGAAQSPFKPVPVSLLKQRGDNGSKVLEKPSAWLFRISAGCIATNWYIENKEIKQTAFNKVGLGGSYAHFIEVEGLPYNDLSINGFVFFPTGTGSKATIAATISALKYINAGLSYDFGLKKLGLLTGISYTF